VPALAAVRLAKLRLGATAPLHYSWTKNGAVIRGAVAPNLSLASLTAASAGTYQLTAANAYGAARSAPVSLSLVPNPFAGLPGAYYGLFAESNPQFQSSGRITLALTGVGRFTAGILSAGNSYSFSGLFDINGHAVETLSRGAGKVPLTVGLNLDLTQGTEQILGAVSGGNWTASLQADRATYGAANPFPTASRGPFTLLLQSPGDGTQSPGGDGYGKAAVSAAGSVSLQGVLSDNTAVASAAVSVSKYGQWPLYIPLYGKAGSLVGWINFTNNPVLAGSVAWFRTNASGKLYRGGFTNSLSVMGSTFLPGSARRSVLGLTNLQVTLSGANLTEPASNSVILLNSGKFMASGQGISRLSLAVNPASGWISGSFLDPATQLPTAIKGAIFQQQTNAGGVFLTPAGSGTFLLTVP